MNMNQLDIQKVLKTSIVLLQYSREKTISARTIQASFRICYIDDQNICTEGVSKATEYVLRFNAKEGDELKQYKESINYNGVEKIIRNFLTEINKDREEDKIKLAQNAAPYLAGLIDSFNG